jgi:hypothetical protein
MRGSCSLRLDGQTDGMLALWEQDGGQDHDRCHREDQRDHDVGGEPKSAAVVPEPHLLAVVAVAAEGRVGLLTGRGEDMVGVGVPEVGPTFGPDGRA